MNYRHYIDNCPPVSAIGLGAWQLGESTDWRSMSEAEALALVHEALDRGVNFFDTAPNYGNGTGEARLGKALHGVGRDSVVINTKFGHTETGDTNFSADYIRTSIEGSLRRLQTDYVDSLIIHNPPMDHLDGRNNRHYEILERLVEEGKIRAYGASLDSCAEMQLFMETTGGTVIEAFFNILHQDARHAFAMAQQRGVAIIAKIPLDSGWLSGKYDACSVFSDIRARWTRDDIETRASLVARLRSLLPTDDNLAHTALAYCLAYAAVTTVIPGNRSLEQLRDNLQAFDSPLPPDQVRRLERFYEEEVAPLQLPW